ncbi:MAG: hypothetical protein A2104_03805 [Candidatus Melainabacteria bacterium GWF2_32_7]|nr:MAG: hypothetical protein A2104_03805 [Candidatus Melainabacteria bacterium GWF2_32_7]
MLKKPIFLTLILSGIPAIVIILSAILETLNVIKLPSFIMFITDIASILLVSFLYITKYNEPIPKLIRLKTAIYCAILSILVLSIVPIISLIAKLNKIGIILLIIMIAASALRFAYIYFGLAISNKFLQNQRNYANNRRYKLIKDLEPDEKIIYDIANRRISSNFITKFIFIAFGFIFFWFQVPYLWSTGLDGQLIVVGGTIASILWYIDYYFFADFLVTNKRVIFKRIYYLDKIKDILLEDIEEISSKTRHHKGFITVLSKKGYSLKSIPILNPIELQEDIEKYLTELKMQSLES